MTPFSLSDDRPSTWEPVVLREALPLVRRRARGIVGLQIIDMEAEDAEQKMLGEVVAVCRRWAEKSNERPPPQVVNAAIRNVTRNLYRTINRSRRDPHAQVVDTYQWGMTGATIPSQDPASPREDADRRRLHVELVAQVRDAVSDSQWEMLQLYGDGDKPREIAATLGGTDAQVRRSIYKARQRAGDVLRSLGIHQTADIERLLERPCDD